MLVNSPANPGGVSVAWRQSVAIYGHRPGQRRCYGDPRVPPPGNLGRTAAGHASRTGSGIARRRRRELPTARSDAGPRRCAGPRRWSPSRGAPGTIPRSAATPNGLCGQSTADPERGQSMSCDVEADLEPLLREVVRRGWTLICCGPRRQPDALVAVNRCQSWTDVVVLRGQDRAAAYRTLT